MTKKNNIKLISNQDEHDRAYIRYEDLVNKKKRSASENDELQFLNLSLNYYRYCLKHSTPPPIPVRPPTRQNGKWKKIFLIVIPIVLTICGITITVFYNLFNKQIELITQGNKTDLAKKDSIIEIQIATIKQQEGLIEYWKDMDKVRLEKKLTEEKTAHQAEVKSLNKEISKLMIEQEKNQSKITELQKKVKHLEIKIQVIDNLLNGFNYEDGYPVIKTVSIKFNLTDWKSQTASKVGKKDVSINNNNIVLTADLPNEKTFCKAYTDKQLLDNLPDNYNIYIEAKHTGKDNKSNFGILIQDRIRDERYFFTYNKSGIGRVMYAKGNNYKDKTIFQKSSPSETFVEVLLIKKRKGIIYYYINNTLIGQTENKFDWKKLELFVRGRQSVEFGNLNINLLGDKKVR